MAGIKKVLVALILMFTVGAFTVLGINFYVILSQSRNILSVDELEDDGIAYIMVLGCGVRDGEPSDMLEDRLLRALEAAEKLPGAKVILTGNTAGPEYDEVAVMKSFCIAKGLDESRIITDGDGFSTGASVTNLKKLFGGKKTVIVTQKYHLYRALHIAKQYGIEACGVASNQRRYRMQIYYSLREVLARNKDFVKYFSV